MSEVEEGRILEAGNPTTAALLRALDWRKLTKPSDVPSGELYATHQATLRVRGLPAVAVWRLSDGRMSVSHKDVDRISEVFGDA